MRNFYQFIRIKMVGKYEKFLAVLGILERWNPAQFKVTQIIVNNLNFCPHQTGIFNHLYGYIFYFGKRLI